MHLHLSGIDFSKENLIALYKVYYRLEKQIFGLLPIARIRNEYCRRLDKLERCLKDLDEKSLNSYVKYNQFVEEAYNELFLFTSSGTQMSYNSNKKTGHPLGYKCGYKHSSARYCWLNFVPAIFDSKGNPDAKTIELRNHSATTSYRKTKYWTLIHMGILWYVENYKRDIFKGDIPTLEQIMVLAYPKTGSNILNYINERTTLFSSPLSSAEHKKVEYDDYEELNDDKQLTVKGALECV